MADDFDAGICSGSWWNSARISRSSGGDASAMGAAASVSCSSAITDTSGSSGGAALSWLSTADVEVPGSSASGPGLADASILPVVPGFGGLSHAPSMNWNNQTLLSTSTERETSFHNMLQEPTFSYDNHLHMSAQEINQQQFLMQQQQQQQPGFPVLLQGLYDPEAKPQQKSIYDQRNTSLSYHHQPSSSSFVMGNNYQASTPNDSFAKFTQLLKSSSPPKQQAPSISSVSTNHLQFSNDAPFWNPSVAAAVIGDVKSGVYQSPAPIQQFVSQSFEQKPNCNSITTKSNSDSATKKSSSSSSGEASLKKPRIDTPSPLPAFKVRKEKLGDRITALQQLVSPFGKTDTASVLHEAIDYIKFLHDQVNMLSTPYMKNGNPMQHQQSWDKSKDGEGTKQDLRSRGLCLVPMESIYPVASETMADLWTPTFGGTYR